MHSHRPRSTKWALGAALCVATLAPTGPASAQTSPASVDAGAYRVGAHDILAIEVFGLENLNRRARVSRDGRVSLPLLGAVELLGKTLEDAEATIAAALVERELLRDPQVSIFVEEYHSRGISVQGAVEAPGAYQVIGRKSLMDVLGEAGGLAGSDSNRAGQKIFIVRKTPDGAQETFEIDAGRLYDEGDASQNLEILPGDVISVPHAKLLRVYVTGAVSSPGAVEFLSSEGITVLQAVTSAGGLTERAKPAKVHIVRRRDDGTQERIRVDLRKIQRGQAEDPLLQKNDTVVVGEWFF